MFLKLFRKRSNQKYINKILNSKRSKISEKKIRSVGIILSLEEFKDYDKIKEIFTDFGINENRIKFITYLSDKDFQLNHWDDYFSPEDFGWSGDITNIALNEFIDFKYDVLISYYRLDNTDLNLVTAKSKANFKIGISNFDQRLNDFIIDIGTEHVNVFRNELEKYLKGLNKIY
jgi:hypothetical protein